MKHRSLQGASLLELLIVLSIIFILFSMSIPRLKEVIEHREEQEFQHQIISALQFARQAARTLHQPVALQLKNDVHVFIDSFGDGTIHNQQQILLSQAVTTKGQLNWRAYPAYRDYLLFTSESADNGSLWYCRSNAKEPSWVIWINKKGRLRTTQSEAKC